MVQEYSLKDDFLYVKINEFYDFEDFISILKDIKSQVKKNHYKKTLINLIGYDSNWNVSEMDRYRVGEEIVNIFHYQDFIKVAFVVEKKEYNGFAEMVATNRGAIIKMFFNDSAGIEWLKQNASKKLII